MDTKKISNNMKMLRSLLIAFEYYEFTTQAFPCVSTVVFACESPVVTVICNSESYWMGQGIILMVTRIQKWDTGFSGRILNIESWYPS